MARNGRKGGKARARTVHGVAVDGPCTCVHVTQFGFPGDFREKPVFEKREVEVSVIEGIRTMDEAYRLMTGRPAPVNGQVRFLPVEPLRGSGYVIMRTPAARNRYHHSIYFPVVGDDARSVTTHREAWEDPERRALAEFATLEQPAATGGGV